MKTFLAFGVLSLALVSACKSTQNSELSEVDLTEEQNQLISADAIQPIHCPFNIDRRLIWFSYTSKSKEDFKYAPTKDNSPSPAISITRPAGALIKKAVLELIKSSDDYSVCIRKGRQLQLGDTNAQEISAIGIKRTTEQGHSGDYVVGFDVNADGSIVYETEAGKIGYRDYPVVLWTKTVDSSERHAASQKTARANQVKAVEALWTSMKNRVALPKVLTTAAKNPDIPFDYYNINQDFFVSPFEFESYKLKLDIKRLETILDMYERKKSY